MKKRMGLILWAAAFALAALSGCAATGGAGTEEPGESGDALVIYVGTSLFDGGLDPIKGAMSYGYSFTNAALLKVDPSARYVGDMASEWTVSDDALVYTFRLREGVQFSDGAPLTAADVVFTYETVRANQAENENVDLTRLATVTALDEGTVEFTLSEPYSPFLDTTALLGIVPHDKYNAETFATRPIGTGPWRVVQYDPNQQIIVAPNEHYYEGPPAIGRVTLVHLDNDAALSAARSGQLDLVMVGPDYAAETVAGMTAYPLETMDIRNISLPVQPVQHRDGVRVGNDVTADSSVRRALAIGIDRATIIQNAYNGIGRPAMGFTDNLPWSGGQAVADNRRDEAAALLDSAGWTDASGSGVRERDGVPCAFDIYAPEDRYALAAALAEDAAALGIRINVHSSSWDEIAANMHSQGVVWGWGQYSPTVLASLFHSREAFGGGYDNVVGYENEAVDVLIEQALRADNQADAITAWQQVQAIADADHPYLYLVNIEHCYFVSDRLDISPATQIPHPHGHGSPILCNMKDWTLQ